MRSVLSIVVLVVVALPCQAEGGNDPADGRFELPAERWAPIDSRAEWIVAGPDGRTWRQAKLPDDNLRTLREIKRSLESEINQRSPLISAATLALIDGRGGAWFYVSDNSLLLGFDGRRWVERSAGPNCRFLGKCPTKGQLDLEERNRAIGDSCWFIDFGGIHRFDGREWSYFELPDNGEGGSPLLAVSPDGKSAVAHIPKTSDFWVWHNARWSLGRKFERSSTTETPTVRQLVITDEGVVWYGTRREGAGSFHSPILRAEPKNFETLLRDLGSRHFDTRELASKTIVEIGLGVLPRLGTEFAEATDPEIRHRLKEAEKALVSALIEPSNRDKEFRIGKVVASGLLALYQDPGGRLLFIVRSVSNQAHGSALIIRQLDGTQTLVSRAELGNQWPAASNDGFQWPLDAAILTPSGSAFWLSALNGSRPISLIKLRSGAVADELPDVEHRWLQAVDRDGHVFAAGSDPPYTQLVMVYSPAVRDDRWMPKVTTLEGHFHRAFVAAGGSVWAVRRDAPLMQFDGRQWKSLTLGAQTSEIVVGNHDVVVIDADVNGKHSYSLIQRDRLIGTDFDLHVLVQRHRQLIRRSFPSTMQATDHMNSTLFLACDSLDNIWVRKDRDVRVLSGEKWIGVAGLVASITPVGDGSKLYLHSLQEHGSLLVSARDSRLRFEPISGVAEVGNYGLGRLDSRGAMWANISISVNPPPFDPPQLFGRINDKGLVETISCSGKPILTDDAENVWLTDIENRPGNELNVWRGGRLIGHLALPGTDRIWRGFSDRLGSAWFWTASGLQRVVADAPSYDHFRTTCTVALEAVSPQRSYSDYSQLGYLMVATPASNPTRIQLIHLPTDP